MLFKAVNDTMRRILGESASELIYRNMEKQILLKREEISEKIEVFYSYLERLLGSEGMQSIRNASLKRLLLKVQQEYEEVETYFSLLDELYEMKFKLSASSLKEKRSVCN